jgi:DNA-binding XRE family transcriptional regulator
MSGTTARYSLTQGIPGARIGWLVAEARSAAGLTQEDLATRTGVKRRLVKRWERGAQIPNDDEVVAIARSCEIGVGNLLPPRDTVEFDRVARSLRVGGAVVSVADVHNEAVLTTYVQLVRQQRGLAATAGFDIRHEDVDALADTLDLEDTELQQRLVAIVGLPPADAAGIHARLLSRRRMSLPAGIVVGSLGLVPGSGQANTGAPVVPPAVTAEAAPMAAASADRLDAMVAAAPVGEPAPWASETLPAVEPPVVDPPVVEPPVVEPAAPRPAPQLEIGDALRITNPDAD